ncbi:peptidylprolyl isomerase [Candidatus Gracilibacteria bacterium]|nr:MAG: peptidylprolyl isomerase [Candidatus Gracilibacteria bacterium]
MDTNKQLKDGDIVAFVKTTKGQFEIFLETEKAPITTANFIGLAKKGYFKGIIFHRIIKNFMIQTGDPTGTGMGGESIYGEKFKDEFHKELKNNSYTVSMANSGTNTNGSQFFINVADNNYLDFKHSVFGEIISGRENVLNISKVKTDGNDKPEKEIKILNIEIKQYKDKKFVDYDFDEAKAVENYKKEEEKIKTTPVKEGDTVSVHYTGTFEDGKKFDSSIDRGEPISFRVGSGQMISGFDEAVVGMKIGDKKSITLPPEKAYGKYDEKNVFDLTITEADKKYLKEQGLEVKVGGKLPTNAGMKKILKIEGDKVTIDANHELAGKTLKFDIELVDKK